ncbi:hypothetical protein GYMLUDRAFT_149538 [Collybiopsis luxurians FD-317 M1]|nr:hypothetical protein GYMLUDRAFT_149538 [Collybiopsis luxurians FD-317 M1]
MHLRAFALVSILNVSLAAQVIFDHEPRNGTIIDALGEDSDYELLLQVVTRARLVPTLNRLTNCTFFAPTNDAIKRHNDSLWNSIIEDDDFVINDNVQEQVRQQLFYHLLNYTIPRETDSLTVLETLHYPHIPVNPPSRQPPPYPPWLPIPGGTLDGQPQRLRIGARKDKGYVGVDAFGNGGSKIVKGKVEATNGGIFGISDVLEPPPNLATVLSQQFSLSFFRNILTPEIEKFLESTPGLTLFLPVNEAWEALDPYERIYLESKYAADDLNRILNMHAVARESVKWSDSFEPAINLTTIDGTTLEITVAPERTTVSDAELIHPDIYASNGVLHLVSSLLIPDGALRPTPEKYLLSLNCSSFVSMIHQSDLTFLINDTDAQFTILAPGDDVLSIQSGEELPAPGSEEMKKLLRYHFIPGKWSPEKLRSGMLIETALQEPGLGGGRQVLRVEVGDQKQKEDAWKTLRFGGAKVLREPVKVDNTLIYFISKPVVPPTDAIETVLPMLDLSIFIASLLSTSVGEKIRNSANTALLIPHNAAFERLGLLVSEYLLSASSKADLEKVLLHHALNTVQYAEMLANGTQRTFPTLDGSDLSIFRQKNGTLFVSASGGWAGMKAQLYTQDILTQTGVVHELSDVLIPHSVDLTIAKLMKAAKGSIMVSMMTKAGFDWVLNGTAPPEGSKWADQGLRKAAFVLLCPPDDAFEHYNLTELYADKNRLTAIVGQHLIPSLLQTDKSTVVPLDDDPLNNNRPLILEDSATYSTLHSPDSAYGDLVFKKSEDAKGGYIVGIKGARGTDGTDDWARVESWGRSTTDGGTGGVIRIDRLLVPYEPPWFREYGPPVIVGVLGVFVICGLFYVVRLIWQRDTTQATYEPAEAESSTASAAVNATAENVKAFVAGGFGGVCAVLVGHPFDLTKTRLQTAPSGVYTGALDVVKKTLARDGVSGMYRGIVPPLLGVTPIFAVSFWAYDASKKLILAVTPNRTSETLSTAELAAAGFLSAVPTTAVMAPVERAKVLLQAGLPVQGQGGSETKYKGVFDVMGHLYKEGGLRSIFRGSGATLARDGPGSAAYFAAYEVTKKALTPAGSSPSELNLGAIIFAGGTAGVAMWSLAIPPDVLKSRIQSAPTGTYSGFMDCARKTIAQDGVGALWKGFGPAMTRAFPANAATFLGVEASRYLLDNSPLVGSSSPARASVPVGNSTRSASSSSAIAKTAHKFELWCTYQNLERAAYEDIPESFKKDVEDVFDVSRRLPLAWVRKESAEYQALLRFAPPEFVAFMAQAYNEEPSLFGAEVKDEDLPALYLALTKPFTAWKHIGGMLNSQEKWSEADFSDVYAEFRRPAIKESTCRIQCCISLPQPVVTNLGSEAARILSAKKSIPDCIIQIQSKAIRHLSNSTESPFKQLKNHKAVRKVGSSTKDTSFPYQATIRYSLPDVQAFEFVSSVWEDKKPAHHMPEHAYRQNRISTAAAARHLHSMHVDAPIFGLTWAYGGVRAHIDWCKKPRQEDHPACIYLVVYSAPYVRPMKTQSQDDKEYYEWHLGRASDILQVHFLIVNIDHWTADGFVKRVVDGVADLRKGIIKEKQPFEPWRHSGIIHPRRSLTPMENAELSASILSCTPPKPKRKTKLRAI